MPIHRAVGFGSHYRGGTLKQKQNAHRDEYFDDYIENQELNRVVNIAFNGEDATVSGDLTRCRILRNGAHLTVYITGKKVYLKVSGSTRNGSIKVYGENKFGIELCNASIHNPHGAAINSQNKKRMYVVLAEGSRNVISDGADYIDTEGEAQKATIMSKNTENTSITRLAFWPK